MASRTASTSSWSTRRLQIANAILLEAGLSFLGLGIAPPEASWGNMLNAARSTSVLEQYPWQWMFPGAALVSPCSRSTSSATACGTPSTLAPIFN